MIISSFVQAQNLNANLISTYPVNCTNGGIMEFELVPINPSHGIINIQLNESNTQISNFPYENQDGTNSVIQVQSLGLAKYTFKGFYTYGVGTYPYSSIVTVPFESSIDYSNIAVNFNLPIAYFANSTTATTTISLVNPYAGFSFKWYGTNANGLVNYSDALASGTSYTSTYGNGRRYYVEGVNAQGCTISNYISKTLVPQTTGLSGIYELTQDCSATESENSNPNIIKPQLGSNPNFSNFEWRWYDKSSWTSISSNADPAYPYTQFSQNGYVINSENLNLDLTDIPDEKEFDCVIFSNGLVYQTIPFQIYGKAQSYTGITFNWDNKNIIFRQAKNMIGDSYDGLTKNKSMWEKANANFDKCTLNVNNTKILVLTERNSFNRVFLKNSSMFNMTGSSKITSTCHTWGGIYFIDRSEVSIVGNSVGNVTTRPEVSNSNVGVCLMRDLKPDAEDGDRSEKSFSLTFPFFEDADSDLDESNLLTLEKALFINNYYHTYFLSPIKQGSISNTVFDCKPERMLYPYEPKIIDGKENFTITEACIVGYNSIYPHTDFFYMLIMLQDLRLQSKEIPLAMQFMACLCL